MVTNDKIIFDTTIETVTKDIMTGKSETKQETDHQETDKEVFPNFMEDFEEADIKRESESDPIIKEYTKKNMPSTTIHQTMLLKRRRLTLSLVRSSWVNQMCTRVCRVLFSVVCSATRMM